VTAGRQRGDPYAGQPGRRIFVAAPLPSAAVDAVVGLVESVRAQALPQGMRDVRWVRLDGLHLTLRFLGPTPEERLAPTAAAVQAAAGGAGPIAIRLAGTGTFPPHGRPRTLWIGLDRGAEPLAALADALDHALVAAGWPSEPRPFRAHLTLARCDGLAAGPLVAGRLAEAVGDATIEARLDRLVVYESVTGGGAARYVPLAEAALAG
jgi:RNA 2',3'-cyclic 3'-phosphodiesterase